MDASAGDPHQERPASTRPADAAPTDRGRADAEFERLRKEAFRRDAAQRAAAREANARPTRPGLRFAFTIVGVVLAVLAYALAGTIALTLWSLSAGTRPPGGGNAGIGLGILLLNVAEWGTACAALSIACAAIAQHRAERHVKLFNRTLIAMTAAPYLLGWIWVAVSFG